MKKYRVLLIILITFIFGICTFLLSDISRRDIVKEKENNIPVTEKSDDNIIVLKIAHSFQESHPQHLALAEKFLPMVENGSGWNIRVEIYPNSQLGEEQEYIQGVRNGIVEMSVVGGQDLAEIWPKLSITEFPYMFDNYDQAVKLLNGRFGSEITDGLENIGLHSLGWTINGFHQISTYDKKTIQNQKLKIGTSFSKLNIDVLESMGFTALPIRTDGNSQINNQNNIDGYDILPLSTYYNGWNQNQKNLFITNHVLSSGVIVINSKLWDELPEDYKILIKEAAKVSLNYEIDLYKNEEKDILELLKEKGVNIIHPDLSNYKKDVNSVYQQWVRNDTKLNQIFNLLLSEKNK